MATKADLEDRIAELEAELASGGDGNLASPSGRTIGSFTVEEDGSCHFSLRRDGRNVTVFDLGREVLGEGRDPEFPDGKDPATGKNKVT